ncbi:MAG: N-acyl homoserine lactonase family protein [Duganella sp.]
MPEACYQVYALRYATHGERRASNNFMTCSGPDVNMPLDFFIWAIQGSDRVIVVDTGCTASTAQARQRSYLHTPGALLSEIGIAAENVTDVVITHMHYDHAGNLAAFPRARFHLQEQEMAFCTGSCMGQALLRHPYELADVCTMLRCVFEDRVVFHRGSATLAPGVWLHEVGGHTRGIQIVTVATERGQIVLASDAVHYWSNLRQRRPFPVLLDLQRVLEAYDTVEALADGPYHIIPGHDPQVLLVFSTLARQRDIALLHLPPIAEATPQEVPGP